MIVDSKNLRECVIDLPQSTLSSTSSTTLQNHPSPTETSPCAAAADDDDKDRDGDDEGEGGVNNKNVSTLKTNRGSAKRVRIGEVSNIQKGIFFSSENFLQYKRMENMGCCE